MRDADGGREGLVRRVWRLPFRQKVRLVGALWRDRRIPWTARAVIPLLTVYLAVPVDIIPDFIPVLGLLDDLLMVGGAFWLLRRLSPPEIIEEHVERLAREAGGDGGSGNGADS